MFQQQVNLQPAIGVAGDFASSNPRSTVVSSQAGLVAGVSLFAGRFAFTTVPYDIMNAPTIANSFGTGKVAGFVHRNQQGLILGYLQEASQQVQPGAQVALFDKGDFFCINDGTTEALLNMKAYANYVDGKVTFALTGAPSTGASTSNGAIAAETFSVNATISNNVMNVTLVNSGTVVNGAIISGTNVASSTQVLSQINGSVGGVGTYYVNIPDQNVTGNVVVSGTYGQLTVGAGTNTGTWLVGEPVLGTNVAANTVLTALGTGTGGLGTYIVSPTQSVPSGNTITTQSNVETNYFAKSQGAAGALMIIGT